jgi:hypothetical protein
MRFLLSIAMLAAAWTAGAQGTSEAILGYEATIAGVFSSKTVGWTFQVATTITVTELGCVANFFPNNPAAAQIEVGLWAPDGSLLASNFITPGSTLRDQSRYESVTPLSLSTNQTYHIGVYFPGDHFNLDTVVPIYGGSVTPAPAILLVGTAFGSGGFASPPAEAGTAGGAYLGPNFRFQSLPSLAIRLGTANQVRLSWPTAYPGFTLQSKLGLFGTWANAGLSAGVVGNEYVALDTIGPLPKYYRLIK